MSDSDLKFSSRPVLMLAAGAVLGLVLVATDLFRVADNSTETVPEGVVATVNGVGILSAEYGAALDRYALSRGGSLDGRDSTLVLDSMIDEELLVQRARDLRIDRNDRLVRDLMAKTVVEVVAMEAESTDPTTEDIAAFYDKNGALFARATKVRVRGIRIEVNQFRTAQQAAERAAAAAARLKAGEDFNRVNREMGDRPEVPLPDRPADRGGTAPAPGCGCCQQRARTGAGAGRRTGAKREWISCPEDGEPRDPPWSLPCTRSKPR